jgi:serine protease inhibitor
VTGQLRSDSSVWVPRTNNRGSSRIYGVVIVALGLRWAASGLESSMTRLVLFATFAVLLNTACRSAKPATCSAPPADPATVSALESGNAGFNADLFPQLSTASNGGNFFYSPFSISSALAMTYAGANGDTAQQMQQTLHLPSGDVGAAFANIDCENETDGQAGGNQLSIANGVFGQEGFGFQQPFLNTLKQDYGAPLQQVDFESNPDGSRQTINNWVSQETQGEIPNLLPQGSISQTTRMVLADAIYFKGVWTYQFDPSKTQQGPFSLTTTSQVQVPLMNQTATFGLYQGQGFAMLEMAYASDNIAIDVVLPDAVDGLSQVAASFTAANLSTWVSGLSQQKVAVTLPRFTLTSNFDLTRILAGMGMPLAFDPQNADFSGIDGKKDLYITAVIHQATVDVDESGTVAAAATGVVTGISAVEEPAVFNATHPFLFLIRDRPTGTVLFVGQMTNPSSGS